MAGRHDDAVHQEAAWFYSSTILLREFCVVDEAACRELNGSLQIEPPGREIFKGKTAPVQV